MSAQAASATTFDRMAERHLDSVVAIEEVVHAHPWTRGNFLDALGAGYHCWVAYREPALVGYGVLMVGAGEAHLLNLSVAAEWQRRGIGTELTRFFTRLAADYGAGRMYLEVRPSNLAARALYGAEGFVQVGVRRDYYPAGSRREDAVVMELQLT